MFPIFDLRSYSEHSKISDSGIFFFFLNWPIFFSPLFFFVSAMVYDRSHNIVLGINFFLVFVFSSFSLALSNFLNISLSVILYFLIYSFLRVFVSYQPYISFKIKSDMFLTLKPICKFFLLVQISPVFLFSESELLHLYIHQLILDTFYM